MARPRQSRICRKRPLWRDKDCPPGICKRCDHAEVAPDRPAARSVRCCSRAAGSIVASVFDALAVLLEARVIGRVGSESCSGVSR